VSDYTNITVMKYEVEDFVNLEHGDTHVALAIFLARNNHQATEIILTPDQAEEIADELKRRAQLVREYQKGKES